MPSPPRRRIAALVAGAVAIALVAVVGLIVVVGDPGSGSATPDPEPSATGRFFAPDSFWNAPLPADQPLDARSDELVAELARQARNGGTVNTSEFSIPVYTVPADQPTVRVAVDGALPEIQAQVEAVPIPPGAEPAAEEDRHLVIWQPDTDTMWEFWRAEERDDGWHAEAAGVIEDVSSSNGVLPNPSGATATGLAAIGGVVTFDDLARGSIDHALAIAIPEPRAAFWSRPANRTDGWVEREDAVPEGARFRLDPDLDLDTLDLHPFTRMLAEAAQTHGIIVRDFAGATVFFGEDPTPSGTDVWERTFDGTPEWMIVQQFPWERLEALPLRLETFAP